MSDSLATQLIHEVHRIAEVVTHAFWISIILLVLAVLLAKPSKD